MGQIALLLESRKSGFLGIWKTSKWATGSPRLQVTVIAQPATDEELEMISEEFSVSLQPAEIRECVSHMRLWISKWSLNQVRKVHIIMVIIMSQIQYSLTNNIFIARLSGRFNWNISKSKISVVEKHPVVEIGVAGLSVFFWCRVSHETWQLVNSLKCLP